MRPIEPGFDTSALMQKSNKDDQNAAAIELQNKLKQWACSFIRFEEKAVFELREMHLKFRMGEMDIKGFKTPKMLAEIFIVVDNQIISLQEILESQKFKARDFDGFGESNVIQIVKRDHHGDSNDGAAISMSKKSFEKLKKMISDNSKKGKVWIKMYTDLEKKKKQNELEFERDLNYWKKTTREKDEEIEKLQRELTAFKDKQINELEEKERKNRERNKKISRLKKRIDKMKKEFKEKEDCLEKEVSELREKEKEKEKEIEKITELQLKEKKILMNSWNSVLDLHSKNKILINQINKKDSEIKEVEKELSILSSKNRKKTKTMADLRRSMSFLKKNPKNKISSRKKSLKKKPKVKMIPVWKNISSSSSRGSSKKKITDYINP